MLLSLTGVDMNRSPVSIDSDNIDYMIAGSIQGTVIATKNQNFFNVLETVEQITEMIDA